MNESSPKFYLFGHASWSAMLAACSNARESIDIEQFIFADDEIGRQFIEILRERSWAGIKVRILCDAVGSWTLYSSPLAALMQQDRIEIRFVNIVSPWRVNKFFSWFFRDHRKLLIIDKKIGFTGGVGIRNDMHDWRDTNVEVRGSIVKEMVVTFNEMWAQVANRDILSRISKARGFTRGFRFITNAPYLKKRFLYHSIIDALRSARTYAYITTPYFVPDRRLARVLRLAVKRGVDVRILLPGVPENPENTLNAKSQLIVTYAAHSYYEPMLRAGVKIYEYQKSFLHSKTMVIDDEWSTVGSFNLDSLSFWYNYEANIVSTDQESAQTIKDHFFEDLKQSTEVKLETWIKRPLYQKIREFLVMPLRRFL
ncbi:MAG TPA: phospholipase D-like domain-containing protein [Candidatus Nanoarchaeia archaeon]|nr:phospholipase D-like domain-containing protein [Candidatus Nanoarchaeia archaeon]